MFLLFPPNKTHFVFYSTGFRLLSFYALRWQHSIILFLYCTNCIPPNYVYKILFFFRLPLPLTVSRPLWFSFSFSTISYYVCHFICLFFMLFLCQPIRRLCASWFCSPNQIPTNVFYFSFLSLYFSLSLSPSLSIYLSIFYVVERKKQHSHIHTHKHALPIKHNFAIVVLLSADVSVCMCACLRFLRLHNFGESVVPRCLCELVLIIIIFLFSNNMYIHISIHALSNKFTKFVVSIFISKFIRLYTVHRYMYISNGNWYSAIWLYAHYITYEPTNKNYRTHTDTNRIRKKTRMRRLRPITTTATKKDLLFFATTKKSE